LFPSDSSQKIIYSLSKFTIYNSFLENLIAINLPKNKLKFDIWPKRSI